MRKPTIFTKLERKRQRVPANVLRTILAAESVLEVGRLTERDRPPGMFARLKAMRRADPSVRPERSADGMTSAGHRTHGALVRGEWRDGIGWTSTAVSAAADVADATSKRTGFAKREAERVLQASDAMIDALDKLRMALPEARRIVAAALRS